MKASPSAGKVSRMPVAGLGLHPLAGLVPTMSELEYVAFRADVAAHGIEQPLEITSEGLVLDGRHRLRAAAELGLAEVPVRVVETTDPAGYIVRSALQRRQLTPSQRAALTVEYLALDEPDGLVATLPPGSGKVREIGAEIAAVCPRTMQDALTVYRRDHALFAQVLAGEIPADRARRQLDKANRYETIGSAPPLPAGVFEVIYADPPWQLGNPDSAYAPEQYYPTLNLDTIKALPVTAADNAVLFLWVPASLLPAGFEVVEAWEFAYHSEFVWVKNGPGLGNWLRNEHEPLLVATRGSFPPPEPTHRVSSVLHAARRGHSVKPDQMYELIERMYPHAHGRLELFARRTRPGWTTWGNQLNEAS